MEKQRRWGLIIDTREREGGVERSSLSSFSPLLLLLLAILSTDSVLGHNYAKCTGLLIFKMEILLYRIYIYHRHMPQSKIVFESPSVTTKANLLVQMDGLRSSPIPM